MREPAKLELLTRRPGDSGFEIHEVQSHQAYLGFRPERPAALRPHDSGAWRSEPTLTDEPEQELAELTADLPPHAEAALALAESSEGDRARLETPEPAEPQWIDAGADASRSP